MTNINPKNIFILSALDKLISEHKANPALFCSIFQQKEAILGLIQSAKIDANKYKVFVAKAFKQQSGIVKACAQEDFNKLKDPKNPKLLQLWFKQITQNTYAPYQKQQKLYKHYQSQLTATNTTTVNQNKPIPPPPVVEKPKQIKEVPQPSKPPGLNMEQLVSFKVLDSMMESQKSLQKFQNLFDRKNKMLGFVARKEMSPEKYKAVLQMFCQRLNGTQLAADYKLQLEGINDFHEGNISEWFKQIYEETKDALSEQNQKLAKLKKGPIPQKKAPIQQKNILPQPPARQSVKMHETKHNPNAVKLGFNIGELNSFKVFDQKLQEQSDNKKNYKQVLQKKKKFIQMVKKGQLTSQKYRSLLIKCISQTKDEQIKETMEFQLSQLKEFHDNNLASWFNDIFSNAQLMVEDQQKDLALLEQGKKITKKDNSDDDIDMKFLNGQDDDGQDIKFPGDDDDDGEAILQPEPKKKTAKKDVAPASAPATSKSNQFSDIFSLKFLDQLMEESSSNTQQFCSCFERKQILFGMMQKGQINAQKYKVLQQKCLSTSNAKLKDCIEMDLFDLKDMCSGNVDEWFESLINDTGLNFQDQQEKYQKIKSGKGVSNPQASQQKQASQPQKGGLGIKQKPNINELVSFSALIKLFQHSIATADILYYGELISKRTKLIDLVTQGRLTPPKYKQINKIAAIKTENVFLKGCIQEELQLLISQFKQNEEQWFEALKQCLNQPPPQLKLPQNPQMKRINALPLKSKIQYLAKRMAPYESLVAYYSSNKLPLQQNTFALNYTKNNRKQGLQAVTLLGKDPQMDLYNLVEQLFPTFTADMFFGGNLASLKKKAQASTAFFVQEIAVLKDYASKIKKATNPQNLQNTKKQIAQCQENIAFLKNWPGKQLTPFPVITQQKAQRYNLDLNTHLDNNEVQIYINNLNGIGGQLTIKIYAGNAPNERFWTRVKNGPQGNVRTIIKLTLRQMFDLMKGDRPVITVRFFQKNFFGTLKPVSQCGLIGVFIRNNIAEEVAQAGPITINYQMRVYKPSKPLITQLNHTTIKIQPAYKLDPSQETLILKELLAKQ